jgi:hypothetical protein
VRRVVVVVAILLAIVPLGTRPSWAACECTGSQTPMGQAARASVLFTGRVTAISTPLPDTASIEFQVERLYKGTAGRSAVVTTPLSGELCHFDFRTGVKYTVFADDHGSTTACSGNVRGVINPRGYGVSAIPLSKDVDTPGGAPAWAWAVIGVALAAASVGTVMATRRSTGSRSDRPSARPGPAR